MGRPISAVFVTVLSPRLPNFPQLVKPLLDPRRGGILFCRTSRGIVDRGATPGTVAVILEECSTCRWRRAVSEHANPNQKITANAKKAVPNLTDTRVDQIWDTAFEAIAGFSEVRLQ